MAENIVIRSKIKHYAVIDGKSLSVSSEFLDELDSKVKELIRLASRRAKENSRNTLMARDL